MVGEQKRFLTKPSLSVRTILALISDRSIACCVFVEEYVPEGGAMWKRPLHEGEDLLSDENELEVAERRRWQEWARHAAEHERQRRIQVRKTAHDSGPGYMDGRPIYS